MVVWLLFVARVQHNRRSFFLWDFHKITKLKNYLFSEAAARARLSNMTELLGDGGELELEDTTETDLQ